MTFIDRLFGRTPHAVQAEPQEQRALDDPLLWEIFGAPVSASGVSVGPQTAMRCTPVAAAVGLISETIGSLPLKVFTRSGEAKEVDADHPVYSLVHSVSNPWTSAAALREQLTMDALLYGAGFALAVRSGGRAVELHRLDPNSVSVERDPSSQEPFFRVSDANGGTRFFGYRDVVHLEALGGVAPITLAREAIALSLLLERHGSTYFGRGGRPDGILHTSEKLGSEALKRIAAAWRAAFGGGKSGGVTVLDSGIEYQPLAFNSVDSQYEELRRFQLAEIGRAFRVNPIFLGDLSRATWSNSEQMARQFLTYTLQPWLRRWEAALSRVLLDQADTSTSIEFVTDGLLEADTQTRASAYTAFRSAGVYTSNELRRLENLPPHPDGNSLASPFTTSGSSNE